MLEKGAIRIVKELHGQFLSPLFLVEKKDAGYRPVVNLKKLNRNIPYVHFKMEGLSLLKELLSKGDYLCKLDLKDAYFTVALHKLSRKYVRVPWRGNLYEFLCLCFGLGPAPRIFTKLMKIPIALMRRLNVRLIIYLDDMLLMGSSLEEIMMARDTLIFILLHLGFVINFQKSILTPCHQIQFLGVEIDSITMTISLPLQKKEQIILQCKDILNQSDVSLRQLTQLIGRLSSTAIAILPAPLQYRALQRQQILELAEKQNFHARIVLSEEVRAEIQWWIENLMLSKGKAIISQPPQLVITSDASMQGWGAACQGQTTGGPWTLEEQKNHINILELKAAQLAILTFTYMHPQVHSIHLQTDNMVALSYIVKMGGDPQQSFVRHQQGDLGLFIIQRDHNYCRIPSWSSQSGGRSTVSIKGGFKRMEAKTKCFSSIVQKKVDPRHRSLCVAGVKPGPMLLFLETRPLQQGQRCIPNVMEIPKRVCFSTFQPNREGTEQGTSGPSSNFADNSSLAQSVVVSTSSTNVNRETNSNTSRKGSLNGPKVGEAFTHRDREIKTSALDNFREKLFAEGISKNATDLITGAKRQGSISHYESAWRKWDSWCSRKQVDPISGPLSAVLDFLAELFQGGLEWSTIAGYRSSISAYHDPIDGVSVGKHPRVCALLKGVFNKRPPVPRYTFIWDVQKVEHYLASLGMPEKLSDKMITLKLTMLIALTSSTRAHEICYLDKNFLTKHTSVYTFHFAKITKTARQGRLRPPVELKSFPDKNLCVCHCIDVYLERTKPWRKNEGQLLLSFVEPHQCITTQTVSRWIVEILTLSGIDTSIFKAHSTRSASASKASSQGISTKDILKRGHWSKGSTFQKFYYRSIEDS